MPSRWPRRNRSIPAQAIIAPLSVQSASGGATKATPAWRATASSPARMVALAATPPATASVGTGCAASARRVFSDSTSATARWKAAQMSARSARRRPPCAATAASRARSTAVFRPEKLMSKPGRSSNGRGSGTREGSPDAASTSTAGPPGWPRPRIFATLSNASPGASSMVPPRRVKSSGPSTRRNWQWPPDTSSMRYGNATPSVSRGVSACPARWFTPTSGSRVPAAIPLASITPAMTPPISPGPAVTAIPSRSGSATPASASACSTHRSRRSAWARAAISGTTPPKSACSADCPATTDDRIRAAPSPARTMAAALSSQLLSMPRKVSVILVPSREGA